MFVIKLPGVLMDAGGVPVRGLFRSFLLAGLLACLLSGVFAPAAGAFAGGDGNAPFSDRIIVKYKQGRHSSDTVNFKGRSMKSVTGVFSVPVGEGEDIQKLMDSYRQRPDVESVQPDYIRRTCSLPVQAADNWGIARVGADTLSSRVYADGNPVVAVIDTGVYAGHPLLNGKVLQGYDYVNGDSDPDDDNGHGSHVAGIAAMVAGDRDVRILPVKVLDQKGYGYDSDIADGIHYAVDQGADILNLSFGGEGESSELENAVNYAVARGVVVVAAAGNDSETADLYYPAGIKSCITVSATDRFDRVAGFSNYGSVVDIAAPGKDILSSVPYFTNIDGYISYSGTSQAVPFVAGIAALLKENDSAITAGQIEEEIFRNADDRGPVGRDDFYGYGIINFSGYIINQRVDPGMFDNYHVFGDMRTGIPLDHVFTVSFSSGVDHDTVNNESLQLYHYGAGQIDPASIEKVNDTTFTIKPLTLLEENSQYWVVINPAIMSCQGVKLKEGVVAKFSTIAN
jgi:hypothetical protein